MRPRAFDIRYSYIRIIACLAVVILHTVFVAFTIHQTELSQTAYAATQSVVHNLMWAVPAFVMVTGALLLEPARKVGLKKLFTVYIRRVLAALIIACIAFRFFDMIMNHEPFSAQVVKEALSDIITGETWGHMWYIYLLIGLYLLLPFYKKIAEHCTRRELLYLLAVYFIFESLFVLFGLGDTTTAFYIHVSTIYPFYLFAGYAISQWVEGRRGLWLALFLVMTAVLVVLSVVQVRQQTDRLEVLFGYSSPIIAIQSMAFFAFMRQTGECRSAKLAALIKDIDRCTFGIYILHLAFVRLLIKHWQINPYEKGIWFVLTVLIAFFGSYLIVTVYKRLRGKLV